VSTGTTDYYALLGVGRDADDAEIKKAFRRRARETHPDVNAAPDAEAQFKQINEAYDVLSDPAKRDNYDRFGSADPRGVPGADFGDVFGGFGMEDLFSAFFGGAAGGSPRANAEGRDMAAQISITMNEAFHGVTKDVVLNRLVSCDECAATGSVSKSAPTTCTQCNGSGQKRGYRKTFLGTVASMTPCENCSATGVVVGDPCPECQGQGRVPDREHVNIEVPAGIQDGMQLRVTGHGESGVRGARTGDLIVTVHIAADEYLHRQGDDLHCRANLSIAQAALGAEIEVCGVDEPNTVSIPSGSQHGDTVKLKGEGMPHLRRGGRGDLIVHLAVVVPRKLDKRQKELLAELGETLGDPERRTHVQKLKDWLTG